MKKFAFLILLICYVATFAAAQKTVRKRPKPTSAQMPVNQSLPDSNQKTSKPYDTPVRILEKPRPQVTDGQDCSQGKVVLRVTFLASGEIGKIFVISGLTKGKTENTIEAARKIKFEPAMKDGKPVTAAKIVEYVFSIY